MLFRRFWFLCLLFLPVSFSVADDTGAKTVVFESGDRRIALLELYSSQGCSSCPRAEHWMTGLLDDERLWRDFVPLVFHVDYWDYLGWKDPYASLSHSQRQRRYRLHGHSGAVYTPGFMLAGKEWRQWFHDPSLALADGEVVGNLVVELSGDRLAAKFVRNADNSHLYLNAAILGFDIHTPVKAGENRGRRLRQDFVVLAKEEWQASDGLWRGRLPSPDFEGRKAVAFWVSYGSDPRPLQAVGGWLRK